MVRLEGTLDCRRARLQSHCSSIYTHRSLPNMSIIVTVTNLISLLSRDWQSVKLLRTPTATRQKKDRSIPYQLMGIWCGFVEVENGYHLSEHHCRKQSHTYSTHTKDTDWIHAYIHMYLHFTQHNRHDQQECENTYIVHTHLLNTITKRSHAQAHVQLNHEPAVKCMYISWLQYTTPSLTTYTPPSSLQTPPLHRDLQLPTREVL